MSKSMLASAPVVRGAGKKVSTRDCARAEGDKVPLGCHVGADAPPRNDNSGGTCAHGRACAGKGMPFPYVDAEEVALTQEDMLLRYFEEKAKNRVMGVQLECANVLLRVREEKRAAKKRVRKAALKLLGWFGFGFGWGVLAVACSMFAPWWTCIAPAVLMCLAWWKAGGEV